MTEANGARPGRGRVAEWWWCLWPLLAGVATVVVFHVVGRCLFDGFALDLGSTRGPTPRYKRFLIAWVLFGTVGALCFAIGLARLAARSAVSGRLLAWWRSSSDAAWMGLGALAGFVIPGALRLFLLGGAPLTDDESAYQFTAELLASGRLRVLSPPLKLFFDRAFMINDGHLYGAYFIGWSALMVPGVWLGSTGLMNALYAALTVPALFLVLRRLAGGVWAKMGVLLYLVTPMLMVGAATQLSHTSCMMALAWMTWCTLRSHDQEARWWTHSGVALSFSLAFLIRPLSALGVGLPLLVWWGVALRRPQGMQRLAAVSAFVLPAVLMAGLFLAVDKAQNGSFAVSATQRFQSYMQENGFRFSGFEHWRREDLTIFQLDTPIAVLVGRTGIALFRLNFDLFGWPCSFVFALLAGVRRMAGLLWACVLCFCALHLFLFDSGIDSFGPVHYFETAWPILLLTVLGVRAACERPDPGHRRTGTAGTGTLPTVAPAYVAVALVMSLAIASVAGYVPVRFRALAQMARAINAPRAAVQAAGLHRALVFAPRPFVASCASWPNEHFVEFRPNNDPDLRSDILWVNHISVDQDRRLMRYFPDRRGYVMQWTRDCRVELRPLDEIQPGAVPDGFIGGTGTGLP